jgi:hypothetical protein
MRLAPILIAILHWSAPITNATAAEAAPKDTTIEFPIVFSSAEQMAEFGMSIICCVTYHPPLIHRCYFYGVGGDTITISHEMFLAYRARGFTLNSLCLGLMSSTRYDPETGSRLPTFIAINAERPDGHTSVSYEHPLKLPDCFRRALPYLDCAFNFHRMTGEPLPESRKAQYAELGRSVNAMIEAAMARGQFCKWPFCSERWLTNRVAYTSVRGALDAEGHCFADNYLENKIADQLVNFKVPPGLQPSITCVDISINLPARFGYALDADGVAGPSISPDFMKTALDPSRQVGQLDPKALAELVKATAAAPPTGAPSEKK